jgi:hypothetical protein
LLDGEGVAAAVRVRDVGTLLGGGAMAKTVLSIGSAIGVVGRDILRAMARAVLLSGVIVAMVVLPSAVAKGAVAKAVTVVGPLAAALAAAAGAAVKADDKRATSVDELLDSRLLRSWSLRPRVRLSLRFWSRLRP